MDQSMCQLGEKALIIAVNDIGDVVDELAFDGKGSL